MKDNLAVFIDKNIRLRREVKASWKAAEENPVTNEELKALLENPDDGRRYVGIKTEQGVEVVSFLFCRTLLTGVVEEEAFNEGVVKIVEEARRFKDIGLTQQLGRRHGASNTTELKGVEK